MNARLLFAAMPLCLLAACATVLPLPRVDTVPDLPRTLHLIESQPGQIEQDRLLVVQREEQLIRWSLFDLFGAPLARQLLSMEDGSWRSDGLLPPNPQARELFAALLFAWTPGSLLESAYPGVWRETGAEASLESRELMQDGVVHWRVEWVDETLTSPPSFTLTLPEGTIWRVLPLE
ncbi:MAG: DUF3261 domain-containing protein [Pseudomonadales bacterium]|jgi:hypothetical protein|nr:DUF3261 domain-containing protein [Pseudomonadales bacterium]